MIIRAIISGAISFAAVYFIPVTAKIIEALITGLPQTLAVHGIGATAIRLGIAIGLWLLLYMLFGGGKKEHKE